MLNFQFKPTKRSIVEKRFNQYMFFILIILLILSLISLFGSFFYENLYETHWHLNERKPIQLKVKLKFDKKSII
jgi:hypothetical protein